MIDQALGFQPVVRRKRTDNSSDKSSPKPQVHRTQMFREEKTEYGHEEYVDEDIGAKGKTRSTFETIQNSRNTNSPARRLQSKESFEEIHSPAIADKYRKKLPKQNVELSISMKNSSKGNMKESVKIPSSQKAPTNESDQTLYKIKMAVFLIISFFLMYQAMTPTRRAPYKR